MAIILFLTAILIIACCLTWSHLRKAHEKSRYACVLCGAIFVKPKKTSGMGFGKTFLFLALFIATVYLGTLVPMLLVLPLLVLLLERVVYYATLIDRCPVCDCKYCISPLHAKAKIRSGDEFEQKQSRHLIVDRIVKITTAIFAITVVFLGVLTSGLFLLGVEHGGCALIFILPVMYVLFRIPMRLFIHRVTSNGYPQRNHRAANMSIALFMALVVLSGLVASWLVTLMSSHYLSTAT